MQTRVKLIAVFVVIFGVFSAVAQDVFSHQVQSTIYQYFSNRFQTPDSTLKITFRHLPNLTRFTSQSVQLQCHSQSRRRKLGYQTVWLHVIRNGRLLVKIPVTVNVQVKKKVVIAAANIPFRSTVQANMLRVEKRWIKNTEIWEQGLEDIKEIVGLETTHFIPNGKFLVRRDVEQPNVIQPGDEVEIWVPAGNLVVTAKGIARSAGKIGQYIYVKDTTTGKRIKAKVESSNVVIVASEGSL